MGESMAAGARVAIGGFQHETNTFAPCPARYEDFLRAGGWPGLTRGSALFDAVAGINIPIAGFIEQAQALDLQLEPLLWTQTVPRQPSPKTPTNGSPARS